MQINVTSKPKGHFDFHLGSEVIVFFFNLEDRNRVFDSGPYFYYSTGLFLQSWRENFHPDKEDISKAPV